MKKVSLGEKVFIIGIFSMIGGIGAGLSHVTTAQAAVIGLIFGALGAAVIGLLHRSRS